MATNRDITWSETSYTPGSLLKSYSHKLPVIVLVDKGHYGDNDTETVAVDQMARIHSWVNQRRVLARDVRGRMLSIPEDYFHKMEVLGKKGKRKKPKKLKHIVRHYYLPLTVGFDRSVRSRFRVGQHIWDSANFGLLELYRCYTVSYLRGNAIHGGVIQAPVLLLPMYIDINVRVAEGLRNGTPAEWKDIQHAYTSAVSKVRAEKVIGETGITLVSKGGVDAKNFAGQGVLVTNNNSLIQSNERKPILMNGTESARTQTISSAASDERNSQTTVQEVSTMFRQNSTPSANSAAELRSQNGNVALIRVEHNGVQSNNFNESTVEQSLLYHQQQQQQQQQQQHYQQQQQQYQQQQQPQQIQHSMNAHHMMPLSVNVGVPQPPEPVLSVDERGVSRVEIGGGGSRRSATRYIDNGVQRSRSLNAPSYRRMVSHDYVTVSPQTVYDIRKDTGIARSTGDLQADYNQHPLTYYDGPEVRGERHWYHSLGGGRQRVRSPSPQYYYTSPGRSTVQNNNATYYRQSRPRPRSVSGGYVREVHQSQGPAIREVYHRDGLQIGLSDDARPGELYYTTQPTAFGGSAQNLYRVESERRKYVTRQMSMRDMDHYGTMPEYVVPSRSAETHRMHGTGARTGNDVRIQRVGSVTVHGPGLVSTLAESRHSSVSSSPGWVPPDDQHGIYVHNNMGVHHAPRRYHSAKDNRKQWSGENVRVITNGGGYRDEHVSSRDAMRRQRDADQYADYAVVNRTGLAKKSERRLRAVPITLDTDTDSNSSGHKGGSSERRTAKRGDTRSPALQSKSGDVHYEQKSPPPPPPPPLSPPTLPNTVVTSQLSPTASTSTTEQTSSVDVNQNVVNKSTTTKTITSTKKEAPLAPPLQQQHAVAPETSVMASSDFYTDRDGNTAARQTASSYAYQQSASRAANGAVITQRMQEQQTTMRTTTTMKGKETAVVMRRVNGTAADGGREKDARESIRDLDNFLQSQSESDNSQNADEHKDLSLQAEVETSWL